MAPLPSPEKSPAASYATGRRSSPVSLADARVLPVSVAAEAGAQRGPHVLGRAVCGPQEPRLGPRRCARGPLFRWAGPTAAVIYFPILFVLLFHRIVLIFKNMYLLAGRSKCYGSNFVEFRIMSSI